MIKILKDLFGINDHGYKVVNIYIDKEDILTFIPTGETKKWHLTKDLIDLSIELIPPYSDADIEDRLSKTMKLCFTYEPEDVTYNSNAEKANASKTYNKKMRGNRLISIHWIKKEGYKITPFEKAKDRGYTAMEENTIQLGLLPTKGDLAIAIKKAIKVTKPY